MRLRDNINSISNNSTASQPISNFSTTKYQPQIPDIKVNPKTILNPIQEKWAKDDAEEQSSKKDMPVVFPSNNSIKPHTTQGKNGIELAEIK